MDIPSKSSKEHLHKVLTFIGLIVGGYLTCPFIVQKIDEKSQIVKTVVNHSYYFPKWSHDDQQAMTLVGLI